MNAHFIPGLGFDDRIFQNLDLPDFECVYLRWIDPLDREENLVDYAKRLSGQIETDSSPTLLIGHSLGGILALEISKILPIETVILISSIRSRKELPLHFKIIHPLRLDRFFTKGIGQGTLPIWGRYHDYVSKEEQTLFKSMIGQQSNLYLQWALRQLSIWNPKEKFPTKIVQVHGNQDRTFPSKLIQKADFIVKGGGHFMVYKEVAGINSFLRKVL